MADTNFISLITVLASALALTWLAQVFHSAFLSPLRKIPGPWYASITSIPSLLATTAQKRQVHYVHDMHKRYGSFVRIAPDQVIISDPAAFKEIHKIGTQFYKASIYKYLNPTPPGQPPYGLFQQTDPATHASHRKLLARGFNLNYLRTNWETTVHKKVDTAMRHMKQDAEAWAGEADLVKWLPLMAGDIIAELMFGESFKMLERGEPDEMIRALSVCESGNTFVYAFPWLYHGFVKWLPIPKLHRAYFQGVPILRRRGEIAIKNSRASTHSKNVFAKVLAETEKDDAILTEEEISIHAAIFLFAGTDTTATTLTYLIWNVLSQPALQKELEKEMATLKTPTKDETLEGLPILNAVIKETLRLYAAAPNSLPRITPPGGYKLGPYDISEGTTVATQAWTMHRDLNVFSNPDTFDHSRWLDLDFASSEAVKAVWCPFGAGSRICIGQQLAMMELRLGAAIFFRACRGASLAASTTPESMEVENIALIAPKGHACRIVLPIDP